MAKRLFEMNEHGDIWQEPEMFDACPRCGRDEPGCECWCPRCSRLWDGCGCEPEE
jgi:hypothetical protein